MPISNTKGCAAKMKFVDSKAKCGIYTFLIYLVVMFEMSVLSGYRFITGEADKYGNGITLEAKKAVSLKAIGENVGWNYIVCSVIIIVAMFLFAMWIGYNRNFGGVLGMIIINVIPFIGLIAPSTYNFFWSYGTAHFLPAMTIFGLHKSGSHIGQIIFIAAVLVLTVVFFFIGKAIRKKHAEKYEYDD